MTPLDYALLAEAAYTTRPTFGDPDSASRAIVIETSDGLAVGFPGTDNIESVEHDVEALLYNAGGLGRVHKGFWDALDVLWSDLSRLRPAVVYGHSLGGALAILYAARLVRDYAYVTKSVYAFEPPRVSADSMLGARLRQYGMTMNLYRNGNDVVPMVPIDDGWFADWQHPASLIQIGKPSRLIPNIEDHAMVRVIEAIRKGGLL